MLARIKSVFILTITVCILTFTIYAFLSSMSIRKPIDRNMPKAREGVINLTNWNFQTNGNVDLSGKWEFFWNELLSPEQESERQVTRKTSFTSVPGIWRNITINGDSLFNEGYATYRLLVKLDNIPENLALNVGFFISSCKIYLDDNKIYEAGTVWNEPYHYRASFNPQIVPIHPRTNQFYITVQVSNFGYANGGFIRSLELGDTFEIINKKNTNSFIDMFLFGSILIMGLYHFVLFFLRRKEFYTLYFSIICFLISIRTLLMGEMLLYNFFPNISLDIFLKISRLTLSVGLLFFIRYIHSFFPEDVPTWFLRLSQGICIFFSSITMATANKLNNVFLFPFQISSVVMIGFIMIILFRAAAIKREGAISFLITTIGGVLLILNDTLHSYSIINTGFYIPMGQILFIFFQSFILFKKLIMQEKILLKTELRMLQAQIKPHFLFNSLNTIISVCRLSSEKAIDLLLNLSDYLRYGFSFKNDDDFVEFETEMLHVKAYLALETARFQDRLKVVFDIGRNITCKVPPYIIQPIVENAVRHGIFPLENGGTVKLSARQTKDNFLIVVEDDGIGMTQEKLDLILNGTDKNSGIGISNVINRMQRIYKRKIHIQSTLQKGTVVSITIPLTKQERKVL